MGPKFKPQAVKEILKLPHTCQYWTELFDCVLGITWGVEPNFRVFRVPKVERGYEKFQEELKEKYAGTYHQRNEKEFLELAGGLPDEAAKEYLETQVLKSKQRLLRIQKSDGTSWSASAETVLGGRRLAATPKLVITDQEGRLAQLPESEAELLAIFMVGLVLCALLAGGYLIHRCLRRRPPSEEHSPDVRIMY